MKFNVKTLNNETIIKNYEANSTVDAYRELETIMNTISGHDEYILFWDMNEDGTVEIEMMVYGGNEWHPAGTRPKHVW